MELQVNYLAVLAAGVTQMILGALWYSPVLFANSWMKLLGLKKSDLKKEGMGLKYGLTFVLALVMAYVLAQFLQIAGVETVAEGITISFWAWLGFSLATFAPSYIFLGKPWKLLAIDNGYYLVGMLITGVILTLWV